MNLGIDRLARDISYRIDDELQRSGIFFRIFARAKSVESIEKKLISFEKSKLSQTLIH